MAPTDDETTFITEDDIHAARPILEQTLTLTLRIGARPPVTVAGLAMALASATHLAKCGPDVAKGVFDRFYAVLEKKQAESKA